jgi:F-type H+-transporting ATPase subunit b
MLTEPIGAAAAAPLATPPVLLAMSGGGVRIDFDLSVLVQMVIFAVLILVLKPLLFDPILRVFEERERRTDGARAEARQMQEEAGELLREYEHALSRVRRVAAEERERIRVETGRLEAEVLEEARASSARILADGRAAIQTEVDALRFDLGRESERVARQLASRVLGREVG